MSIPHVFDLAGNRRSSDAYRLPTVETIADLEEVLTTGVLHDAAILVANGHEDRCEGRIHNFTCGSQDARNMLALRVNETAHDWYRFAFDLSFGESSERKRSLTARYDGTYPYPIWSDGRHSSMALPYDLDQLRSLSEREGPIPAPADLVDWRGKPALDENGYHRDPLFEFWRAKHFVSRQRHEGARSRTVSALNAQLAQLEPVAVKHAHSALLDPLNAALEAALNEQE